MNTLSCLWQLVVTEIVRERIRYVPEVAQHVTSTAMVVMTIALLVALLAAQVVVRQGATVVVWVALQRAQPDAEIRVHHAMVAARDALEVVLEVANPAGDAIQGAPDHVRDVEVPAREDALRAVDVTQDATDPVHPPVLEVAIVAVPGHVLPALTDAIAIA